MTVQTWIAIVGNCAAVCTTGAFVPQVWKIWKQGGRDLSYSMLTIYLFGVLLWLIYGLLLRAEAVILANAATLLLVLAALVLKLRAERRAAHPPAARAGMSVS
jgi:MtN3 and saliva related transmembrane protein